MKRFLPLLLLACAAPAYADPLSVSQLLEARKLPAQPQAGAVIQLGARPMEKFQVKGVVSQLFRCPQCPPGAYCEPCGDFLVLSDDAHRCTRTEELGTPACSASMQVYLDNTPNHQHITPGTELTLELETSLSAYVGATVTPQQRSEGARNQQILKKVLDSDPSLERTSRPEWLKDIPGESYRLKR